MTRVEVDNLHAQGIAVLGVVEQEADEAEKGFARGVQLATVGNDEADAIGYPADVPLLYADDNNDPDPAQEVDTMSGVKSVGRRESDMYSGGNVLVALQHGGLSPLGGWMVETWFPHDGADPCMVQLANTRDPIHIAGVPDEQFDTDLLLKPIPAWGPNGVVMLGGPIPQPSEEDESMYFMLNPHAPAEVWCVSGNSRRHVGGDEWAFLSGPYGGSHKAVPATPAWFDSIYEGNGLNAGDLFNLSHSVADLLVEEGLLKKPVAP